MTERQKLLLIFIGSGAAEIDPIRTMKGQFIIAQETPAAWLSDTSRYDFVPYNFGPCSFEVYSDLNSLERDNLINGRQPAYQSWKFYSLSEAGKRAFDTMRREFRTDLLSYIGQVRQFVDSNNFRSLLGAVYNKYPEYAVNSVFRSRPE